jgi:methylmalonyl-CoA mutase
MSDKVAWLEAAKSELKQANPLEQLQKQWGDWPIKPYYDADDRTQSQSIQKIKLAHKSANGWLNLPLVDASFDDFNALAVSHLNNGADGVCFRINGASLPQSVLKNIKPEFCFLGFEAESDALKFFLEADSMLVPAEKIHGAIFWKENPEWLKVARLFKSHPNFRCFGIHVGTLDAEKIERAFRDAIATLDELTDNTFPALYVFPKFAFSATSTNNFFLDVAMIRSIKILFERLVTAYGVTGIPAFVRYETQSSTSTAYDPHGIMLSNSINVLSAVAASTDAITVHVENQNSNMHLHTARSISVLLKEESKLDKVIDPLAGSYFIENLTDSIVEKIWTNLKNA